MGLRWRVQGEGEGWDVIVGPGGAGRWRRTYLRSIFNLDEYIVILESRNVNFLD